MRPKFIIADVARRVNQRTEEIDKKTLVVLKKIGEEFINKARETRTYKDRTGNLRSSIGYKIFVDGKEHKSAFHATRTGEGFDKDKAAAKGSEVADREAQKYKKGMVLIGVAGMEYARPVESKGYDVISGSEPRAERIKKFMDEIQ